MDEYRKLVYSKCISLVIILGIYMLINQSAYATYVDDGSPVQTPDDCGILSTPNAIYTLTQNVSTSVSCFNITADNIILDGNGFSIHGIDLDGTEDFGIYATDILNLTIKNVFIIDGFGDFVNHFDGMGIYLNSVNNSVVTNLSTNSNAKHGIALNNCSNDSLSSITSNFNPGYGIWINDGSHNSLSSITANSGYAGIWLKYASNNIISSATLSSNYEGIIIRKSSNNIISSTNTSSNSYGISIEESVNNSLSTIIANLNDYEGLYFSLSANNSVSNSTTNSNNIGINIDTSSNITIYNTTTNANAYYGVYILDSSNNFLSSITADSNSEIGIYFDIGVSQNNILLNLNISNSTNAILDDTGNQYINYLRFNNSFGEISWINEVDDAFLKNLSISPQNLSMDDTYIQIKDNYVFLNSTYYTGTLINSSANITLYGLSTSMLNPKIYRDGEYECNSTTTPSCYNFTDLNAGTVSFNVSSWSSYSIVGDAPGIIPISNCTNLTIAGATYQLQNNISSDITCIQIQADNIILDGNGYPIVGNDLDDSADYGIYASDRLNIIIKNFENISGFGDVGCNNHCNGAGIYLANTNNSIIRNSNLGDSIHAVHLYASSNNTLSNLNITTYGPNGYGTYLQSNSNNNQLSNLNIATFESNGHGSHIESSSNNILTSLTITTSGGGAYGTILWGSSNNNQLSNITITTSGSSSYGITLQYSSNNTFTNLIITTYGYGAIGTDLFLNVDNNQFSNLAITTTGDYAHGTNFYSNSNSLLSNLNITTSGLDAYGTYLYTNSNSNTLSDFKISSSSHGLYLDYSSGSYVYNNIIVNPNIITNGTGRAIYDDTGNTAINYLIFNNSYGEISWINDADDEFLKNLTILAPNLSLDDAYIQIKSNYVYMNSTYYTGSLINGSANITLYGVSTSMINPKIFRDGEFECDESTTPSCYNFTSLNASTVKFNVSSWSNYSIKEDTSSDVIILLNNSEWLQNETTNFSAFNTAQLENLSLVVFANENGKIEFSQNINMSQSRNLTNKIKIEQNKITINSALLPEFNKSANLTFKNVTITHPIVKKNDIDCSPASCSNISFSSQLQILRLEVISFSTYTIVEQCSDGTMNSDETGIDCGGLNCVACSSSSNRHYSSYNSSQPIQANKTSVNLTKKPDINQTFLNISTQEQSGTNSNNKNTSKKNINLPNKQNTQQKVYPSSDQLIIQPSTYILFGITIILAIFLVGNAIMGTHSSKKK